MKKSLLIISCIMFAFSVLMTSCKKDKNEVDGYAPNNIAGKTMVIRDFEGDHELTIQFRSNTSAKVDMKLSIGESCTCSSIEYKKTGAYSATVQITNLQLHFDDGYSPSQDKGNKNYSLIFTSPNEGTVKGSVYKGMGYFDLF